MKSLSERMLIISFDCLGSIDYEYIKNLPNFQKLLKSGSYCRKVETIYPSLTYPCHTTIVTGRYPKNHGVVNNTLLQPGRLSPDWHWFRKSIKGTTLYDEAYKKGLTTAALLWPVTGRAKGIQFNLPEIFPNRKWQNQLMVSLYSGSLLYQWELDKRFGHLRRGLEQPYLDHFVLESAVHTILTKQPHLMLVHFTDLDTMRHHYGVHSEEAKRAMERHDERLGRLLEALEVSGQLEETTIVVLGDHAALDEEKAISLNVLFKDEGLITVNEKGKVIDWQVYCKSCDGSAYIYLKNEDEKIKKKVEEILHHLMKDRNNGIEEMIDGKEAGKRGADPNCTFMLEASYGSYFIEEFQGNFIHDVTIENRHLHPKFMVACHGYSPKKANYETFFLLAGKGVRPDIEVDRMHLVDIGPTLAKILGLDLGRVDGTIRHEFILDL